MNKKDHYTSGDLTAHMKNADTPTKTPSRVKSAMGNLGAMPPKDMHEMLRIFLFDKNVQFSKEERKEILSIAKDDFKTALESIANDFVAEAKKALNVALHIKIAPKKDRHERYSSAMISLKNAADLGDKSPLALSFMAYYYSNHAPQKATAMFKRATDMLESFGSQGFEQHFLGRAHKNGISLPPKPANNSTIEPK